MKRLLILVAFMGVTSAKPETYREKEDFQYSRSSTDEGSKSGFYGAQRGNMGGNYERAHNMDSLAQHQMSGVVRQVDGELGDAANSKRGNVISSASTRGMYGHGNYDLSNLGGRNFQEGTSYTDSQSASSATGSRSAGYTGHSSSYSGSGSKSSSLESHDLQNSNYYHNRQPQYSSYQMQLQNNAQGHRAYEHSMSEHSASEHQSYGQSNYGTNSLDSRHTSAHTNPGATSSIILQAYDDSQRSHFNAANADAEVLNNHDSIHTQNRPRHYESSYNYHKEWEKHNVVPAEVQSTITTESPNFYMQHQNGHEQLSQYARQGHEANSRLNHNYGAETSGLQTQRLSSSQIGGHSRSNYQSNYDADYNQRHQSASSVLSSNVNSAAQSHSNLEASQSENQEGSDTRPKTYQSSYSYHKSWERQGDPYIIQPVSGASANLQALDSDSSANRNAYASHHYGSSRYRQSHQSYSSSHNGNVDCDENGHARVARSYQSDYGKEQKEKIQNTENQHKQTQEYFQQPSQNNYLQDMTQQIQTSFGNSEDFGQQIQNLGNLEDFGQQTQNLANLEDFGQQVQTDFGQQTQEGFGHLEDFGQQVQTDFGQQTQEGFGHLEDFGQQIQSGSANLENFGQQVQSNYSNFEDFGQHTQELTNLGQQTQTGFGDLQELGQHVQQGSANLENFGQQVQSNYSNVEDFGQHTQEELTNFGQQAQTGFGDLQELGQHVQGLTNLEDLGQHTQSNFGNLENEEQQNQIVLQNFEQDSKDNHNFEHQVQGGFFDLDDPKTVGQNLDQVTQNKEEITQNNQYDFNKLETMNQQAEKEFPNLNNFDQQVQAEATNENHLQQETQINLSDLENLEQHFQTNVNNNKQEDTGKLLGSHIFGQDADNMLNQEQSTYGPNEHIHYAILPIENSKSTSQSLSDGGQRWNENNFDTYEHSHYHTSSSHSSSNTHWSYSQTQQSNLYALHSNQQSNDSQKTSEIDSLWDEIYGLMARNQTDRENNVNSKNDSLWSEINDTRIINEFDHKKNEIESEETQHILNNTQQSLFPNTNDTNIETSYNDHLDTNQNDKTNLIQKELSSANTKPTIVEPVRSPNFGRGDIESDDFLDVTEPTTDQSMVPYMFGNENSKRIYEVPEDVETLSLITETTTVKKMSTGKQLDINNHFHELDTNNDSNNKMKNDDKNKKVTELQENFPEERNGKSEYVYQSSDTPHQRVEDLDQQSLIDQNYFSNDENLNQNQQIQSMGMEDFGQEIQIDWNKNEDSVLPIHTPWNPIETEKQKELNFEQVNFNVLPPMDELNLKPLSVPKQYVLREGNPNVANELSTHRNSNNTNDTIDSTTELSTTLESITEKTGFWRSVGNKFSNAKDRIVSWFHRS